MDAMVADRSVSVPVTLNDFEKRGCEGLDFSGKS